MIKDEDLLRRDKSFEKVLKAHMGDSIQAKRGTYHFGL
jgi:hypothetical protein